jgi:hypothetical protein
MNSTLRLTQNLDLNAPASGSVVKIKQYDLLPGSERQSTLWDMDIRSACGLYEDLAICYHHV